jgi:hypothetical protein
MKIATTIAAMPRNMFVATLPEALQRSVWQAQTPYEPQLASMLFVPQLMTTVSEMPKQKYTFKCVEFDFVSVSI